MNHQSIRHAFLLTITCLLSLFSQAMWGEDGKTTFHITVLKSNGDPQPGMVLKISGRNETFVGDKQGIITFQHELGGYTRTANLYFPADQKRSVASFSLDEENTMKTFYLDSPQDLAAFKQSGVIYPIEGFVTNSSGIPIVGAVVSVQGTGRRTLSDEIGLFQIDADFSHPITFRADGMETRSLPVQVFLQSRDEPYAVILYRKNSNQVYAIAEKMPEFPGGMKAYADYLKRNLEYPAHAKKAGKEGVVVVQFVVEKDGKITSPAIVRGLEASMDTAALQAIREMPHWIPAQDHGITVRCKYSVPVQFKIERPKPAAPKPAPVLADSLMSPDSLRMDTLLVDSLGDTLLRIDSVPPMHRLADTLRRDSLQMGRMLNDSLRFLPDSLHRFDERIRPDSLLAPAAAVAPQDSLGQEQPVAEPVKPKKRNIFVRFFRWLFGLD